MAAPFIRANRGKQTKYWSVDKWISKVSYVHTMEYYPAIQWNEAVRKTYVTYDPWKYYAKWKKPDTKDRIVYDSVYMNCSEEADV